ncbi:MAG: hypothetical protein JWO28_1356 [Hyphomicrobiales bacterium]|jgi:hypothetical protein|nr:hypothetical protein [Hyphomicrobiales bacterium]
MGPIRNARRLAAAGNLAAICFSFGLSGLAAAQERPNSVDMTCAQTAGIVASHGYAVIGTGPNVYDRYVASRAYCTPTENNEAAFVATADQRRCFIGYTCKEISTDRDN